jgi:hypothetical protein
MKRHLIDLIGLALPLLLLATGCPSPRQAKGRTEVKEKPDIVQLRTKILREAEQKRNDWKNKLKAMDAIQLAAALTSESDRGLEPFNSMAYVEAISRGEATAPALAQSITKIDRSSLLTLLAVRKTSASVYNSIDPSKRVALLVESLRASKSFNTWGLPHVKWEYAAESLIAEGKAAERSLTALLDDRREAPVWGNEDYLEYEKYKYRVCDYAWAMLAAIRNQPIDISPDQAVRDRQIAALKSQPSPL